MNQRESEAGMTLVPRAASSAASCGIVMSPFSVTRWTRKSRWRSSLEERQPPSGFGARLPLARYAATNATETSKCRAAARQQ